MAKTIGILGGMGPAATIDLLLKIYASSSAKCDQQHVRVIADIDPSIPDRTEAILTNKRAEIVEHLGKNARGLAAGGADYLAMACNTAHEFLKDIEKNVSIPFVNMIEVTVEHIVSSGFKKVGLLGTNGTLAARLYIDQLEDRGVQVIVPEPHLQNALMQAIYSFKGGESVGSSETAREIFRILLNRGAETVIAACTELPILLAGEEMVDPTSLLAKHLVSLSTEG